MYQQIKKIMRKKIDEIMKESPNMTQAQGSAYKPVVIADEYAEVDSSEFSKSLNGGHLFHVDKLGDIRVIGDSTGKYALCKVIQTRDIPLNNGDIIPAINKDTKQPNERWRLVPHSQLPAELKKTLEAA